MYTNEQLVNLLGEEATLSEILRLLREARERLTATNNAEAVRVPRKRDDALEELQKAARNGHIPPDRLISALQDAEENGSQHVVYYVPVKGKGRSIADGEAVANSVLGEGWKKAYDFPNLQSPTEKAFIWADFRIGLPGKPRDWMAKFYDREVTEEVVPEDDVRTWVASQTGLSLNPKWKFKVTREIPFRSILLARWNDPGVLEIRVSRRGLLSRTILAMREQIIWSRLSSAVKREDLTAWALTPVLSNMVRVASSGDAAFRTSRTTLQTALGTRAEFERPTTEEALQADKVAARSIVDLMSDGGGCQVLTVNFLAEKSEGDLEQDLQIIAGAVRPNEVVIRAEASARAVDYVTDQFRAHR